MFLCPNVSFNFYKFIRPYVSKDFDKKYPDSAMLENKIEDFNPTMGWAIVNRNMSNSVKIVNTNIVGCF